MTEQFQRRLAAARDRAAAEKQRADYVRMIAFADIFGAPESNLGAVKRPRHDPHLRISVEGGEIATMILHGSSTSSPKRMLPANFQLQQIEDAVAEFVEGIVGTHVTK